MHAPKTLGSTADFTLRVWCSAKTWGVELRPALTALPVLAEVSQAVNSLVLASSQYATEQGASQPILRELQRAQPRTPLSVRT